MSFADFGPGVPAWAAAVDRQSDGKLVVAGWATVSGLDRFALARFNPDGTPDTTFGTSGTGTVTTPVGLMVSGTGAAARDMRIMDDDSIVLGGTAYWYKDAEYPNNGADTKKNTRVFALVGYTADGIPNPEFGSTYVGAGKQTGVVLTAVMRNDQITALAQSGSSIIAAGTAKAQDPPGKMFALAKYAGNGALDTSFGDKGTITTRFGGTSFNNVPLDVFIGTGGEIVVIGTDNDGSGGPTANFAVAKFSQRGTVQEELKTLLSVDGEYNAAYGGELLKDGKILIAGVTYDADTDRLGEIVTRLKPDLTLDTSFGKNGYVVTFVPGFKQSSAASIEVEPDGSLITSGFVAQGLTGPVPWTLNRYWADGTPDASFGDAGVIVNDVGVQLGPTDSNVGYDGGVDVMTLPDGGNVAAGTGLATLGGQPTFTLARYATTTVEYDGPTDQTYGDWQVKAAVTAPGECATGTARFVGYASGAEVSSATATVTGGLGSAMLAAPTGMDKVVVSYAPTSSACLGSSHQTSVRSYQPAGKLTQRPTRALNLPKRLFRSGRTMLLDMPVRTNAGQKATVRVKGTGIRPRAAGEVRGRDVRVFRRNGRLYVWLSGDRRTTLTVKVQAPATAEYNAYKHIKKYRTSAARA